MEWTPEENQASAEDLVARLRRDPSDFRSVREMTRAAGVGSAKKLDLLLRHHYHSTPLEMLGRARGELTCGRLLETSRPIETIGADAGYESSEAFHDDFRRRVGMDPRRYRRLRRADSFDIDLPSWYPRERVLRYLGRDPKSPIQRVDGNVFRFVLAVNGTPTMARAELEPGQVRCTFEARGKAKARSSEELGPTVHALLQRLLGLAIDPRPFERRLRRSELRRLIDGQRGLTIPQTHDLTDGLLWVIAGQQVSLAVAFTLRRRLTEGFGRRLHDGFALAPGLETIAQLEYTELQAIGFSRRKSEYLIDLARSISAGEFDLEALARSPVPEIERRLLAVRGFGAWSVHYLMMRALALGDCVPVGDVALAKSLGLFFELGERPDKPRVLELMAPFAPYRSLATFHLWNRLGNIQ